MSAGSRSCPDAGQPPLHHHRRCRADRDDLPLRGIAVPREVLVSRSESSTEMPGAALRGARGTLRAHPPRRPSSALPAALLAYRSTDMRAALLAGALISAADAAIFRRTSG